MKISIFVSSTINPKFNGVISANTYPDIEKAVLKTISPMSDTELMNSQFTLVVSQQHNVVSEQCKYVFGMRRATNQRQTREQIFTLAEKNKYAKNVECTQDGNYLVIDNFPRGYTSAEHSAVPIPRQTTLTYGQASFPVYTVDGLSKRPAINPGQPLPVVVSGMQKRLREEQINKK